MKTTTSKVILRDESSWHAPDLNQKEAARKSNSHTDFPRENFDGAPYPFAILLGATTTLLLITTIRTLWYLVAA